MTTEKQHIHIKNKIERDNVKHVSSSFIGRKNRMGHVHFYD